MMFWTKTFLFTILNNLLFSLFFRIARGEKNRIKNSGKLPMTWILFVFFVGVT